MITYQGVILDKKKDWKFPSGQRQTNENNLSFNAERVVIIRLLFKLTTSVTSSARHLSIIILVTREQQIDKLAIQVSNNRREIIISCVNRFHVKRPDYSKIKVMPFH